MAVSIRFAADVDEEPFVTNPDLAYTVSDSGVLILLFKRGATWRVRAEYGPTAWLKVSGTRYQGEVRDLDGDDRPITAFEPRIVTF